MNKDFFDNSLLIKIMGKKIKHYLKEKNITITKWAELSNQAGMKKTQGDISNFLNGKKGMNNDDFILLCSLIGLNEKKLELLFQDAEIEEYKYKYGVDILNHREMTDEEVDEAIRKKYNLSKEEFERLARAVKN